MSNIELSNLPIFEKTISKNLSVSYYYSMGSKDITIVLIHGLGSSKEDFLPILNYEELTSYDIIFADLVGHGDSSTPKDFSYSMDDQAKVLFNLLNILSMKSEVVIVAHSMGGPIAVSLTEMLGNKVAGIVYAEGNLDEGDCFFSKIIATNHTLDEWKTNGFKDAYLKLQEDPDYHEYVRTFKKAGPLTTYKSSQDLYNLSVEEKILKRLIQISVPVLAIYGEQNKGKFTSESKLTEEFPLCFIPEAAHGMMLENPDAFYQAVIDFLIQF
ncbi:MAG: alpha/beta hydrolase [Candidatus Heimdallarchaeota archaeon]|nr:alpha/beta hydrolase [Candidatus Heimdallarchaeota archaeon]MBY8995014.1 alpha/beta hydrolase [Candidatus Heimdallarchaeota archaeon]